MTEPARTPADLAAALDREVEGLERELSEIELLAGQARSESGRHEQKRAHLADKLAALIATPNADRAEIADENAQLVTLTKRFALMDAQIEVLQGKQKVLTRYRDGLANLRGEVATLAGLETPDATAGRLVRLRGRLAEMLADLSPVKMPTGRRIAAGMQPKGLSAGLTSRLASET